MCRERKRFTRDEKMLIGIKTGDRCGHCGRKLSYDQHTTVEHIVPVSKQGTDKDKNLILLCDECNKDKGNFIADPVYYYPYIKQEYLKDISDMFDEYTKNPTEIDRNNVMVLDILTGGKLSMNDAKVLSDVRRLNSPYGSSSYVRNNTTYGLSKACAYSNFSIKRAVYSDLNDVYLLALGANKELDYPERKSNKEIKDLISYMFLEYVIYLFKNGNETVGYFFFHPSANASTTDEYIRYFMSITSLYLKYVKFIDLAVILLKLFLEKFFVYTGFTKSGVPIMISDKHKANKQLIGLLENTFCPFCDSESNSNVVLVTNYPAIKVLQASSTMEAKSYFKAIDECFASFFSTSKELSEYEKWVQGQYDFNDITLKEIESL